MALQNLTVESVTNASGTNLTEWACEVVNLEKRVKTAQTQFAGSLYDSGLVVYGVKLHHKRMQDAGHVGGTAPWVVTWKMLTKTEKPAPRATTMAIGVEAFVVESKHLEERQLRGAPGDSVEIAVGIYRDVGEQYTHEAVVKAAGILAGYTGPLSDKERKGLIKQLRVLRKSLKPAEPAEPMDEEDAVAHCKNVLSSNPQFLVVVATELVAALRYEKNAEILHGVWSQFQIADSVWPVTLVETWLTDSAPTRSKSEPTEPAKAETPEPAKSEPTEPAKAETPEPVKSEPIIPEPAKVESDLEIAKSFYEGLTDADYDAFAAGVNAFREATGKAPENPEELDAFLNAVTA